MKEKSSVVNRCIDVTPRYGNVNGSVSCSGKENCERNTFSGYVQCDDKESVRCD